jgi:hypothetical protein
VYPSQTPSCVLSVLVSVLQRFLKYFFLFPFQLLLQEPALLPGLAAVKYFYLQLANKDRHVASLLAMTITDNVIASDSEVITVLHKVRSNIVYTSRLCNLNNLPIY